MSETQTAPPAYATKAPHKVRRLWLSVFLLGPAACLFVAMLGITVLFAMQAGPALFGLSDNFATLSEEGFPLFQGAAVAALAAALNWFFFYLTIPAAWIAMAFSLARFPRRRIVRPAPYYRWGVIWGATIVTAVSLFGVLAVYGETGGSGAGELAQRLAGAALTGALIGAVAGMGCAGLFRLIVRPARQVREIEVDAF